MLEAVFRVGVLADIKAGHIYGIVSQKQRVPSSGRH